MDEKSLMVKPTATVSQKIVDNTGAYIQGGSGKGGTSPPLPIDFEGQLLPLFIFFPLKFQKSSILHVIMKNSRNNYGKTKK